MNASRSAAAVERLFRSAPHGRAATGEGEATRRALPRDTSSGPYRRRRSSCSGAATGGAPAGPAGSAQIEQTFERYFDSVGEPFKGTDFTGRSDYGPFIARGIPSGGLFTGAEGIKTATLQYAMDTSDINGRRGKGNFPVPEEAAPAA